MNTYNKIIFVCMGNTCRSPMAATIMQNRLSKNDNKEFIWSGVLEKNKNAISFYNKNGT